MKSSVAGRNTSRVEVTNVSAHGVWLLLDEHEYFLSYEDFPWFRNATIAQVLAVRVEHGRYLSWPLLDVDLELDSIEHPENYLLRYKQ
jgi:hypothetical protein